jgi:ubiquinone/menaquinone biosynthesis C-methylase UbiE
MKTACSEMPESVKGINDGATVKNQYRTADKLNTRISIHSKYSVNRQGFGNWITSHYQIREGAAVLELGCGTGDMWTGKEEIISRCSRFILSDFSEGMLDKARETLHNQSGIEYCQIDIQDIPFADQTFDVVIANMMLYHVPDLQKGLREVRRVLKTGGTFYCATYGEHGMMEYICSLFADYQVQNSVNDHFTLQNGEKKLKSVFSDVRRFLYEDSLEVTDVDDMVDYICSLTGMTDLRKFPRDEVKSVLEKNLRNGVLHIPKEYGMFIAGPEYCCEVEKEETGNDVES